MICLTAVSAASAQYDKVNIIGIRGGLNASMFTTNLDAALPSNRQAKLGWFLGVSDQILLSRRLPFYLETGLFLSNKGGGYAYTLSDGANAGSYSVQFGATYLQIPLKVNYHFDLGSFTLEPYFGFHYNVGLWGRQVQKADTADLDEKVVMEIYGDGISRRSDFGVMLGLGGTWSDYWFGLGWEAGFLNMLKLPAAKGFNSSVFQIQVGYNF